eukprot:TRINITY_DN5126_c0_g1_i1.p1 TRINITY_DN5126_c0_g1~~TRINITY_DN5126_c0_g1_i1.p1  ORF type:complete len:1319 (-),score=517.97 TRINITY_DN5126_c0_g1_i1:43-3999(-)
MSDSDASEERRKRREKEREERERKRKEEEAEEEKKREERRLNRERARTGGSRESISEAINPPSLPTQTSDLEERKKQREDRLRKAKEEDANPRPSSATPSEPSDKPRERKRDDLAAKWKGWWAGDSKKISLLFILSGIYCEEEQEQWLHYSLLPSLTISQAVKKVLKKVGNKSLKPDDCNLLSWDGASLHVLNGTDTLESSRIGAQEVLFLRPKTTLNIIIPGASNESLHFDLKTPVIHALTLMGQNLGWEMDRMDDYLFYPTSEGTDALDLQKTFAENKITDGDTIHLIENGAASEMKKSLRKSAKKFDLPKKMTSDVGFGSISPEQLVKSLQAHPKIVTLLQLEGSLAYSKLWFTNFLKCDGLNTLIDVLTRTQEQIESGKQSEYFLYLDKCVHCLQIIINKQAGLAELLTVPQGMRKLVTQLQPKINTQWKRRRVILDIFSAVSAMPEGHALVLDAMDYLKTLSNEKKRFEGLIDALTEESGTEFKRDCMSMLNTLINTPEDITLRVNVRDELINLGILNSIKKLRKITDEEMTFQLDLFEDDMKTDQSELKAMADAGFGGVDYNDIDAVFKELKLKFPQEKKDPKDLKDSKLKEKDSNFLLSILQRLLVISQDEKKSMETWKYIDSLVEKVVQFDGNANDMFVSQDDMRQYRLNSESQIRDLMLKIEKLQNLSPSQLENQKTTELQLQLEKSSKDLEATQARLLVTEAQLESMRFNYEQALAQIENLKTSMASGASAAGEESSSGPPPPPPPPGGSSDDSFGGAPPPPPPPGGFGGNSDENSGAPPPPPPPGGFGGNSDESSEGGAPPPPPPPFGGPPPPPGGGPPPPPLPPGGPPGGPPLPPGGPPGGKGGIPGLPPKPVIKPKQKLKHLNWKKIPDGKITATLWKKAADVIDIDTEEIENLFCQKQTAPKEVSDEPKKEVRQIVNLLDTKRANHIGIALGRFKFSNQELKKAIVEVDDSKLTHDDLISLMSFLPTSEELNLVREYQGDKQLLDKPEQFFLEVESVPYLVTRVELWTFSRNFDEKVHTLLPDIETLKNAFEECMSSKKFLVLLEIVLALGNYLNGNTFNGRAYGFKMEVLTKLEDTKASNNKTLLHYLVQFVEKKYPEVKSYWEELKDVPAASKIAASTLREELQSIKQGVKKVEDQLELFENSQEDALNPMNAHYYRRMSGFAGQAKKKLHLAETEMEKMMKLFEKLAAQLGEDPETFKWEELFQLLNSFNDAFNRAKEDLEREKFEAQKRGRVGPRRGRTPSTEGPASDDVLKETRDPKAVKERVQMRRAISIRAGISKQESKKNLNNLLDMLTKMEKTQE